MELFNNKKLTTIHNLLYRKQETIAVAESVTSGLLQLTLAQAEKAAEFFQGGICVYNLGQKCRHLAVEPIHAQAVELRFRKSKPGDGNKCLPPVYQ